ncbi:MAG: hypothetical protein O3A46_01515, partial [Candidatus Poribacteria bacterium]|nr:hypothetical protein [Candidatus Poribacteria bacterium]
MRRLCVVWLCVVAAMATAQSPMVRELSFVGDGADDLSNLPTRVDALVDQPYSGFNVRKAIEDLYRTGNFAQVRVYRLPLEDGSVALKFDLQRRLRVGTVSLDGEIALRPGQVRAVLRLTEGPGYADVALQRDVRSMQNLYARNGYFRATITPKTTPRGRLIDLVHTIQAGEAARFGQVAFEGNETLSTRDLWEAVGARTNEPYTQRELEQLTQRLVEFYRARGYLHAEVNAGAPTHRAETNRVDVTVAIHEGRRVRLEFVGNKAFKAKTLREVAALERLNMFALQTSRANLETFYRSRGYVAATVDEPEQSDSGTETVATFTIREDERFFIEDVQIEGNEAFSDGEILGQIGTRARGTFAGAPLLSRLSSDGIFSPLTFDEDRRLLEVMYQNAGYRSVRVTGGPNLEGDGDKRQLIVRLNIAEGSRSVVKETQLVGNEAIGERTLRARLRLKPGDPYSVEAIQSDFTRLRELYRSRGYPYMEPTLLWAEETGVLTIQISEGTQARIGKITVSFENANPKTKPDIILREMVLKEGDPFNATQLALSRQRIFRLGFFAKVDFVTPGYAEGRETLDVRIVVRERAAGEISFSGG